MNGHERSAQPCAIITRNFGSVETATRRSVAEADPANAPFREVRSHARATSFDNALYRASVFQPTVLVTQSTIAVVVGAIMLSKIGSFVSCVGLYGNGSYAVTFGSYRLPSLPVSRNSSRRNACVSNRPPDCFTNVGSSPVSAVTFCTTRGVAVGSLFHVIRTT